MDNKNRIEELVELLNKASYAYYNDMDEIMSNYEWDALYDELVALEEETGYVLSDSPTQNVGSTENIEDGIKEEHEYPALSLAKSKEVSALQKWANGKPIWLSWKLDGLTLVLTYDGGKLTKLMTRGNGVIGTNITYLADYIDSIPKKIADKGHVVLRGEAVISYDDFERLNETIENEDEQYANPRNLVSGTLGLDKTRAEEVRTRGVQFLGFKLVYCEKEIRSWGERMNYVAQLGFKPIEKEYIENPITLPEVIERWTQIVKSGAFNIPVDGLVIAFDDTEYAKTGSVTNHHATNEGMAFKWQDKVAETTLTGIEWSCGATSITPVAMFEPVQLEGTEVKRASLCNISEMKRLGIGANGQTKLGVIKANMIIPKCVKAESHGTTFEIPKTCPVCGAPTKIHTTGSKKITETLHCTNPKCIAKHMKKYMRFVSKSGLNIDGLSIKTVSRFINEKIVSDFTSIFEIEKYKDIIVEMDGFGEKSFKNLVSNLKKAKKEVGFINFIYSLSIPMIGIDAAKKILTAIGSDEFENRLENMIGFEDIDGIGPEKSNSILEWYQDQENKELYASLKNILNVIPLTPTSSDGKFNGMTFVITGNVHLYKNRNELKTFIENNGGKVAGSVSSKTNYLINNDVNSSSSKNKAARSLNIPIISEEDFQSMF